MPLDACSKRFLKGINEKEIIMKLKGYACLFFFLVYNIFYIAMNRRYKNVKSENEYLMLTEGT